MSDISSPCLDELSVVRDCATDRVSPLRGGLRYCQCKLYNAQNHLRALGKSDVIIGCQNLHRFFCALVKTHSSAEREKNFGHAPFCPFLSFVLNMFILHRGFKLMPGTPK